MLNKDFFLIDRKFVAGLASSVLIHLFLITILVFQSPPQQPTKQLMNVTYVTLAPPRKDKRTPIGVSNRADQRPKKYSDVPLSHLVPKISHNSVQAASAQTKLSDLRAWSNSRSYDKVGITDYGTMSRAQIDFLRSLWEAINRSIPNNPFLSEYNHTGQVFLRFDVDSTGRLNHLHASAIDRVLKVISARAVRTALKDTADIHFLKKRMTVNARFSWASYQTCTRLRGIRQNYLSFCHYAENKRKSFSKGEKVSSYAKAILLHGPWAVQDIKEYNREERHRKYKFDPFESMRRDPDWNL